MNKKLNFLVRNKFSIIYVSSIFILLAATMLFYHYFFQSQIGPEQPIPFSHRLHTQQKNISCFMCHPGAINTARAGVPPLQTCMLCHEHIIIHHPEIEKLRNQFYSGDPIKWVKVEDVPDYVYFNHSVHIHRQIDCGECHGNVKEMDRIEGIRPFRMGFCVSCHQEKGATTDCFTCHR